MEYGYGGRMSKFSMDEIKHLNMWRQFSPYNFVEVDNPVFQREQRRLRWLKTPQRLLRYNRIVWIVIPALIWSWWLIEVIQINTRRMPAYIQNRFPLILLITIVGVMLLSSAYTVIVTISRVHRQYHSGDWDILRLTTLPETRILAAKDVSAQIRAWPFVAVEMGLRAAFVVLITLTNFYNATNQFTNIHDLLLNGLFWLFHGFVLIIGLAVVGEAVLRMRVLVAWSTIIALQVKNAALALLAGFVAALVFHLSQAVALGLVWWQLLESSGSDVGLILFALFTMVTAALFYGFYIGIRRMSNNFIRRKAFAPD